jgi:hypothetical protein
MDNRDVAARGFRIAYKDSPFGDPSTMGNHLLDDQEMGNRIPLQIVGRVHTPIAWQQPFRAMVELDR